MGSRVSAASTCVTRIVLLELNASSKISEDVALRLAKVKIPRELLDDGVEDGAVCLPSNEEVVHVGVDHAHQLAVDVEAVGAFLEAGLEEARLLEMLPEVHVPVPAGVLCAVDGAGRNCKRSWFLSWRRLLAGHP